MVLFEEELVKQEYTPAYWAHAQIRLSIDIQRTNRSVRLGRKKKMCILKYISKTFFLYKGLL